MGDRIETSRLTLHRTTKADVSACHSVWSDLDATSWSLFPTHTSLEQSEKKLGGVLNDPTAFHYLVYASSDKARSTPLGIVGVASLSIHISEKPSMTVGYSLRGQAWGQGYATEAVRAMIQAVVEETQLSKLVAWVHPLNEPSQNVMRKLGFELERTYEVPGGELMMGKVMRTEVALIFAKKIGRGLAD